MNIVKINKSPAVKWLGDIVERPLLEKLLSSFSKSTGLKAVLVDTEGNTIVSPDMEFGDCRFCQMIRSDATGIAKCKRSYARAGKEAAKYGEPYIFRCHAGLIAWAAPILLDNHVGSIICGQVLMWEPEDYFLEEIEEMVRGLDVDVSAVKWAAAQLDVMSSDKVQAAADLLFVVANQIMKSGMTVLEQRRQISAQQARLAEEIQARKQAEVAIRTIETRSLRVLSLNKEHELKAKVRNGEREAGHKVLENILSDVLERYLDKFDSLKTRIMELFVIVSRAAADGGADLDDILKINADVYRELLDIKSPEEVCIWACDVLDLYIDMVIIVKDRKNTQVVSKAAEYIRQNYKEKLTIDEIAQEVYLSPCYLSRIFKQSLGCTLMEYLTRIRVEKAKSMLKNPKYNVMQVAEESGFEDPGHFSKVFKKIEGISPSRFKQNVL